MSSVSSLDRRAHKADQRRLHSLLRGSIYAPATTADIVEAGVPQHARDAVRTAVANVHRRYREGDLNAAIRMAADQAADLAESIELGASTALSPMQAVAEIGR